MDGKALGGPRGPAINDWRILNNDNLTVANHKEFKGIDVVNLKDCFGTHDVNKFGGYWKE